MPVDLSSDQQFRNKFHEDRGKVNFILTKRVFEGSISEPVQSVSQLHWEHPILLPPDYKRRLH